MNYEMKPKEDTSHYGEKVLNRNTKLILSEVDHLHVAKHKLH